MKIEYVFNCELSGRVVGNRRDGYDVKDFRAVVCGKDITLGLSSKELGELIEVFLSEKIQEHEVNSQRRYMSSREVAEALAE